MSETIVRIAARGEGVTETGRHVPLTAPGDRVFPDGSVEGGPGRQVPPCRHFPVCGGCRLQHLTDDAFAGYCESRVAGALAQHGLKTSVRPALLSSPRTRRRATLHAVRVGNGVAIGFHEAASKRIVDMRECHILRPELFALVAPLRKLLGSTLGQRRTAGIQLTLADQGVDVGLSGIEVVGLAGTEALTDFGLRNGIARLSLDEGLGAEVRFEPEPVTIALGSVPVPLPPGAFLQATREGESALVAAVREAAGGPKRSADLFAGLGTFALALTGEVVAVEAGRDAILALKAAAGRAGRRVTAMHRDLYRSPLQPDELDSFDAVILDPPRAGATEQVLTLAKSQVPRIAYVSCNPATFARDAEVLVSSGYSLTWVQPVGQFRWSTHVELAAAFTHE